jgi:asparagine synthase (glutamine-hydrolysing)
MCGIAGIFEISGSGIVNESTISQMCDAIIYRGPDDGGVLTGEGFGMGSRRLAILDISPLGHMPMKSDDERYIITYNGEVYNFQEIREDLTIKGIHFHSGTDTEVILKAYLYYGAKCLNMFNGMFAFAIHDTLENKTFIARDRLGIKPLFYAIHNNRLIIVSEIKSFWVTGLPKKINSEKFDELFCLRYIAGEDTIYKGIKKLLPGHYLELIDGNINITQWWSLGDATLNHSKIPSDKVLSWYKETFDDSVRLRKISDVPIGVLLSGGLDSSSIAASVAQNTREKLSSFTVRFDEEKYDEGDLAHLVADKYSFDFNELYLDPSNIFSNVIEILKHNDEPIVHSSDIFVEKISEYAKSKVTVLLSGEGGDETLGGYVRYEPLRYVSLLKLGFLFKSFINAIPIKHGRINKLIRMLSLGSVDNFILYNSSEILPEEVYQLGLKRGSDISYRRAILNDAKRLYPNDPLRQVMYYDMHTYLCSLLDRNDMMTMRASIECRVPFLDYRLIEGLASLSSDQIFRNKSSKSLLRAALGDRLPEELLKAKKWGFGVPWKKYYREDPNFRSYLLNISNHPLVIENFYEPAKIDKAVRSFLAGDDTNFYIANQLVNICLWYDVNFRGITDFQVVEEKKHRIFYVGNFLAKHGKYPNFNVFLISRLQDFFDIISSSDKKSKMLRLFDMARMFLKSRKKIDFVIIDVFSTDAFWFALILATLAKMSKKPYINILHGGNLPKRLKENKSVSQFLFNNSYRNISPSLFLKEVFLKEGYKVDYLPNFIELKYYKFTERKNIKCNILWLRAFHKIYNPTLAIKVLKILVDNGIDAKLCMVGPDKDGSISKVVSLAEELHVKERLTLTGLLSREEWIKISENYDIFMNTSNIDNHPVSVLEAMALGFPIISTNIGGLPYLIDDNTNGILMPADDENAFAGSIMEILNNPEKVNSLSRQARQKAELFTWSNLRENWLDLLNYN